jgi:hypothetical protein
VGDLRFLFEIIQVVSQAVDDMKERRQEQEKMLAITLKKIEAADEKVEKLTGVRLNFFNY